ncbi:MAG: hypothetical protein ACRC9L_06095 [Brevinema sp.]
MEKEYRGMAVKYGYVVITAKNEAEALEKMKKLDATSYDWSDPDDEQIVEEVDY